ncbi:MAG TPA: glucose-6-phosphate isomerase [Flavobacteriales bacterium]|nr:glucose-6-phosphate isomerase [Flavobacteriales bacterium]
MKPVELESWKHVVAYFETIKDKRITDFFTEDRLKDFSFEFNDIFFDFSKHRLDKHLLDLLIDFAYEMATQKAIEDMFSGKIINKTENRAVLHTALRQQTDEPILVNGEDIIPMIRETDKKLKKFVDKVTSGQWLGYTGKPITDIVNIGIGGSDLGPKMVVQALNDFRNDLNIHFLSNIDPFYLDRLLDEIDLETTLFIVVSKSFSTQETLTNAKSIQQIYIEKFGEEAIAKHFATVSTKVNKAKAFGIHPDNVFPMWDWVGGRYSLWSPAGIAIPLAVGYDNYKKLKEGAFKMDQHFKTAPLHQNLPVRAALLTVLYNNLYQFETEAYIPYADKLKFLPDFLQQLMMESNGKSVTLDNEKVNWQTGNIVWGNVGTNSQHSFFQLLHQGTKIVPVNFIAEKANKTTKFPKNHKILLANMIAQSEALMIGETNEISYKNFEGNRPSTTILLNEITPESIGSLLAYFEHKTFTEAWLWQINAFDQFGVELGKKLALNILYEFNDKEIIKSHDVSTNHLIDFVKETK